MNGAQAIAAHTAALNSLHGAARVILDTAEPTPSGLDVLRLEVAKCDATLARMTAVTKSEFDALPDRAAS